MKNKKITPFLILAVIAVWGYIIFKIYKAVQPDQGDTFSSFESPKSLEKVNDEYELSLDYQDPFLPAGVSDKTSDSRKNITRSTSQSFVFPTEDSQKIIQWPMIKYKGAAQKSNLSKTAVVIEIDGQSMILGRNQEKLGISIAHVFSDSITLKFQNEFKTFTIN